MKKSNTEILSDYLVKYLNNGLSADYIAGFLGLESSTNENFQRILSILRDKWEEAPCDEEGPTKEQQLFIDSIVDSAAVALMQL
ncbi:MAG: hypothetical protein E6R04_11635 [Spirochaetes bacterium]|nr:MAG: hypothetical protein E6R04_11635 [Spirochaetota bacterium]